MAVPENLQNIVEAALLAAGGPLSLDAMQGLFLEEEMPEKKQLREVLQQLAEDYQGRGIEVVEVASGWRIHATEAVSPWISRLWSERPARYSRALMETLALIAYRQPITRGEIEDIRGVSVSSNIVKTLLEREWIRVVGQRDVPGKPSLYGTTREFLDYFNLKSLDELPTLAEIRDLDEINRELELEDTDKVRDEPAATPTAENPEEAVAGEREDGEGAQAATVEQQDGDDSALAVPPAAQEPEGSDLAGDSDAADDGAAPADRVGEVSADAAAVELQGDPEQPQAGPEPAAAARHEVAVAERHAMVEVTAQLPAQGETGVPQEVSRERAQERVQQEITATDAAAADAAADEDGAGGAQARQATPSSEAGGGAHGKSPTGEAAADTGDVEDPGKRHGGTLVASYASADPVVPVSRAVSERAPEGPTGEAAGADVQDAGDRAKKSPAAMDPSDG
jgi:segregation and condensation protein B